jgi:hypothetical protein
MTTYRNGIALGPPPTLEKQLEVLRAARTLLAQERDDAVRRRAEEAAALRRRAVDLAVQQVEELRRALDPRLRSRVIRYNADEPRVPRGDHGGGQWTSGGGGAPTDDEGNAPASGAVRGPERGPQYAQASTGTLTDAADSGGNTAAGAAQRYPLDPLHDLFNVIVALIRDSLPRKIFDGRHTIWSDQIPADSPKHPEPFLDSSNQPILDDKDNQILRPADLPPETYVQAGLTAKSHNLADYMHDLAQAVRGDPNALQNPYTRELTIATVAAALLPFAHGGSFDAERFDFNYVCDYRHYTSLALGIYMAAAGVSREDMLTIADFYAGIFSTFHEKRDPNYPHSTKQDIQDNIRGYELYESGRIRPQN